jgi:hypothetical protein
MEVEYAINNNNYIDVDAVFNNTNRTTINFNDNELGSIVRENRINKDGISKEDTDNNLPILIYRFKFTEEFMEELYNFSKIHQYDERKDFKEAWKNWTEDNETIIDDEMRRLLNLGYEGDVLDKMFKSARYYFRKKSSEKKEPRQRRQYISVNRELLDAIDKHIEEHIYNADYQPKTGFIIFCKDNENIVKETISKIYEQGIKESQMIEDKIKKTYKNRYFMLTNKK